MFENEQIVPAGLRRQDINKRSEPGKEDVSPVQMLYCFIQISS